MNALLAVVAIILAAGGLCVLEWRRPDRQNRIARLGATCLAVGALALLGWRPTWRRPGPDAAGQDSAGSRSEAALWTAGAVGEDETGSGGQKSFALPDAMVVPPGATVLPDAGTLRRRFPGIGALHIYGDGLEAFDLPALQGLRMVFDPGAAGRSTAAAFTFVRCPRELPLGEPLTVQGRVDGLPPGKSATVTLEAPDGTASEAVTAPADAAGGAGFSVNATPPPAVGRFLWRLRVDKAGEQTLGVAVVPPDLPRVLVLASAPRFDTAALRRWFERAGGTLAARTQVGQDRYRFESAHEPPPQFANIDAPLLAGFDLVLADGRTLAALPPPERDALRAAVADTGLGLLVLADNAVLPDAPGVPPEARAAFFPWKLLALGDVAGENSDRPVRVTWPGQARPSEIPLPAAPFEIAGPPDGQTTPLMRDGQGHTLAAAWARGRGQIALTVVRETDRWTRGNDPGAFAAYWSALFSPVARRTTAADAGGRWTLAGGEAGPVFVDQPLDLVWLGPLPPTGKPAPTLDGAVTAEGDGAGAAAATLPLARDPAEPGRARGIFWPRRAGWHRVEMTPATGRPLDFFVHATGDWRALTAARRRSATERFALDSGVTAAGNPPRPAAGTETVPIPAGGWFALFLIGAGYLWAERRRTA